ncbi:MAG: Ig-like domain-containing protein [Sandaracinaceae bacterium]
MEHVQAPVAKQRVVRSINLATLILLGCATSIGSDAGDLGRSPDAGTAEPDLGRPDAGATDLGLADAGPAPITAVVIEEPADGALLTSAVNIVVRVDGGVADAVEVFVDDELVTTLTEQPYRFFWSFVGLDDGLHVLRAEGVQADLRVPSEEVQVETDTTPPMLDQMLPASGADYVANEPIFVFVSELLGPESLDAAAVTIESSGGDTFDATLSLNEFDPSIIEIQPSGVVGPTSVTVRLIGVRDRAGRRLSTVSRTYPVPRWGKLAPEVSPASLGQVVKHARVAAAGDGGERYLGALIGAGRDVHVVVYRWDTWRWRRVGTNACTSSDGDAEPFAWDLEVDDLDQPVVAVLERSGTDLRRIQFCRYDGSSWVSAAPAYLARDRVTSFDLAVDTATGEMGLGVLSRTDLGVISVDIALVETSTWTRIGPDRLEEGQGDPVLCVWDDASRLVCGYGDFQPDIEYVLRMFTIERYDTSLEEWELLRGDMPTTMAGRPAIAWPGENADIALLVGGDASPHFVFIPPAGGSLVSRWEGDRYTVSPLGPSGLYGRGAADGAGRVYVSQIVSDFDPPVRSWRVAPTDTGYDVREISNLNPLTAPDARSVEMATARDGAPFMVWSASSGRQDLTAYQYSGEEP